MPRKKKGCRGKHWVANLHQQLQAEMKLKMVPNGEAQPVGHHAKLWSAPKPHSGARWLREVDEVSNDQSIVC